MLSFLQNIDLQIPGCGNLTEANAKAKLDHAYMQFTELIASMP